MPTLGRVGYLVSSLYGYAVLTGKNYLITDSELEMFNMSYGISRIFLLYSPLLHINMIQFFDFSKQLIGGDFPRVRQEILR
ncbi:hypothetical protein BC781_101450 [Sediminitomix flava]|uniref:Uncharacterized protein n=1 Tax=Sediminitomix flava TaxID=379075 RepID=A0A315ZG44_SEDFL|nr:hypothetical protein BC781_101450 [Sediminitomix flava]